MHNVWTEETVISSWKLFDIVDCVADIDASLRELKTSSINACWKNLWPKVLVKGNHLPPITNQGKEIIEVAHQIGGDGFEDIRHDETHDVIESHGNEQTEEELLEMMEDKQKDFEEGEDEKAKDEISGKRYVISFLYLFLTCVFYPRQEFFVEHLREILILQQLVEKALEYDPFFVRSLREKLRLRRPFTSNLKSYRPNRPSNFRILVIFCPQRATFNSVTQ
ncbi:hypothetical protein QE152_g7577 [Popillia japonica]|uniref:Uncharacterized protein n=1 Tax=Popillia japonica TaxID=7064 RepID=A0AAW1MEP4_POPJA